jgi:hypothetical protein
MTETQRRGAARLVRPVLRQVRSSGVSGFRPKREAAKTLLPAFRPATLSFP